MSDAVARLRQQAESDGIEFFFAMFVDMHGKPCAKLIPAASFDDMMNDGAGFAGFAAGPMGQSPASPDMLAMPDPDSYTRVPWRPELAVLQCDPHVEGEPWPYAPRLVLKRQAARLAERGWTLNAGVEAEHFLVRRTPEGGIELADALDRADKPCYDAKGLSRMYEHLTQVSRHMNELGWANYANDHEDANGQFEQNIAYADALETADRTIFFRYMVHTLAHEAGMAATFMPKPFDHLTGSGLHVHASLWEGDEPLFESEDDERGLGLTKMAYQFIAGLLEHAPGLTALVAPTVNSYKRMGVGAPTSGATWAPAYATFGGNNRTLMIRVPEPGRFEHRGVDGSANPYLALAGMIAAGLDGIDRGLDPGTPWEHQNFYAMSEREVADLGVSALPRTLADAARALAADEVLRQGLGPVPDGDYVDYFVETKLAEFYDYHAVVSNWEVDRYLTLF